MDYIYFFATAWLFFGIGHLAAFIMFRKQLRFPNMFKTDDQPNPDGEEEEE
jgi:hypothetical protein